MLKSSEEHDAKGESLAVVEGVNLLKNCEGVEREPPHESQKHSACFEANCRKLGKQGALFENDAERVVLKAMTETVVGLGKGRVHLEIEQGMQL